MGRDPTKVGRARVGAELIAEVVNGFVEPISWKTPVRLLLLLLEHARAGCLFDHAEDLGRAHVQNLCRQACQYEVHEGPAMVMNRIYAYNMYHARA